MCKMKHGGKRKGAGRKKGVETDTISFRVPKVRKEELKQKVKEFIKTELKD